MANDIMDKIISLIASLMIAFPAYSFHGGPSHWHGGPAPRHDFRPCPPPHYRGGNSFGNPWIGIGMFGLGALTATAIEESRQPVIVQQPVYVSPVMQPQPLPPPPPAVIIQPVVLETRMIWQEGYWEILPNGVRVWHSGYWRKVI